MMCFYPVSRTAYGDFCDELEKYKHRKQSLYVVAVQPLVNKEGEEPLFKFKIKVRLLLCRLWKNHAMQWLNTAYFVLQHY